MENQSKKESPLKKNIEKRKTLKAAKKVARKVSKLDTWDTEKSRTHELTRLLMSYKDMAINAILIKSQLPDGDVDQLLTITKTMDTDIAHYHNKLLPIHNSLVVRSGTVTAADNMAYFETFLALEDIFIGMNTTFTPLCAELTDIISRNLPNSK